MVATTTLLYRVIASQWATFAVLVIGSVAYAFPTPGAAIYSVASPAMVCLLFLLQGLALDMSEFRAALLKSPHVHIFFWTFSLVATPLIYYGIVYRNRLDTRANILSIPFSDGTMTAMAMPTTASTSLIFTQEALGDASLAALNMAGAQLLGTLVAPAMADALLIRTNSTGGDRQQQQQQQLNLGPKYAKLSWEVVAPLVGGVCLQLLTTRLRRARLLAQPSARRVRLAKTFRKHLGHVVLVFLLWLIFSKAFDRGTAGVDGKALAKLVGWIAGVHVVTLGLAWLVSGLARLSPPRRIAFALVCPQKTEGMAIALIGIIFPDKANQGEMMLPIVAYHSVQMLVAALIVPLLRGWGVRRRGSAATGTASIEDEQIVFGGAAIVPADGRALGSSRGGGRRSAAEPLVRHVQGGAQ